MKTSGLFNRLLAVNFIMLSAIFIFILTKENKSWFAPGDFTYSMTMLYHAVIIPVWTMIILLLGQNLWNKPKYAIALVYITVAAAVGAFGGKEHSFSLYTVLEITGMVLAEVIAVIALINILKNKSTRITLPSTIIIIAIAGMLLATFLGHIKGAINDFPKTASTLLKGADKGAFDSLLDSHSHEVVTSFLTILFVAPLVVADTDNWKQKVTAKIGLWIILIFTVLQICIYQYTAWIADNLPTLFANGLNGIPFDDFVLSLLGAGYALLVPFYLSKQEKKNLTFIVTGTAIIFYLTSVILNGIFIEFNEQFFGQGELNTPGVLHDKIFIRAHLLYGFLIIPVTVALSLISNKHTKNQKFPQIFVLVILILGFAGSIIWFALEKPFLIKLSFFTLAIYFIYLAKNFYSLKE